MRAASRLSSYRRATRVHSQLSVTRSLKPPVAASTQLYKGYTSTAAPRPHPVQQARAAPRAHSYGRAAAGLAQPGLPLRSTPAYPAAAAAAANHHHRVQGPQATLPLASCALSISGHPIDHQPSSSSRMLHGSALAVSVSRANQLQELQALLGYSFSNVALLDQACTHDSSGCQPSYRELAFVGDAVLWLLFAEHAFRAYGSSEDPISGNWPAHLSSLLSRASCSATARQWGVGAYLQHSTPQHGDVLSQQPGGLGPQQDALLLQQSTQLCCQWVQSQGSSSSSSAALQVLPSFLAGDTSTSSSSPSSSGSLSRTSSNASSTSSTSSSSSSSSSSSGRGMYAGAWTTDTLAEMFEGVVGALFLDCGSDFEALKQLLLPWVASSLSAFRAAAAAAAGTTATADSAVVKSSGSCPSGTGHAEGQGTSLQMPGGVGGGMEQQQLLQDLQHALDTRLQERCGFCFASQPPLSGASQHMLQLMTTGASCAEAESLKFLGFGILQFVAALQAYCLQQHKARAAAGGAPAAADGLWPAQLLRQQEQEGQLLQQWLDWGPASVSAGRVAGRSYVVHQMSQHAAELTTVRHRAKMLLLLLEGTPWCPTDSLLTRSSWKRQKQALARCLDLLLAAVYLDSGLEAAVGVAGVLLRTTPPTTHDKSWMPAWARQSSRSRNSSSSSSSSSSRDGSSSSSNRSSRSSSS